MRRFALLLRKDLLLLARSRSLLCVLVVYPLVLSLLVGGVLGGQGARPRVAFVNEDDIPKIARPSEADLPGHLAGEPVKPKTNQTIIRPPSTLPKTGADGKPSDFQLSYALDMLHGKVALAGKPAAN